jgi:hypothetical protein
MMDLHGEGAEAAAAAGVSTIFGNSNCNNSRRSCCTFKSDCLLAPFDFSPTAASTPCGRWATFKPCRPLHRVGLYAVSAFTLCRPLHRVGPYTVSAFTSSQRLHRVGLYTVSAFTPCRVGLYTVSAFTPWQVSNLYTVSALQP